MAEERKPKIDLKARLGKTPAPAPVVPVAGRAAPVGAPVPRAPGMVPTPASSGSGLPGVPVGPPPGYAAAPSSGTLDPSHPLAAVAAPYRPQSAPPAQPTRIEVDEM